VTVVQELRRSRAYNWGAIYVLDSEEDDFDPDSVREGGSVWATSRWITIGVLNARTVFSDDARGTNVEMVVRVQDRPVDVADYNQVIDLPSGVVNIGDAHENDNVELHPGWWLVQINLDPPEEARTVEIYLSPRC